MQTTYVFGHKIPDTDTVCASIALSYLKNKQGLKCEPRILGSLNKETSFVLDYFNFKEPAFLNDVKVQIRNMHYLKNVMIEEHVSIYRTYKKMAEQGVTGFPLVNDKKILTGYVNVKEISGYLIEGDITKLETSYDNILDTLGAKEVVRIDDEIKGNILAAAYKSETFLKRVNLTNDNVLIVGDRYKIQEYAIDSGVKLVVLVNDVKLPKELLEKAIKNRVNVVSTPLGTYKCANKIRLCNYVKLININKDPVCFNTYDSRDDFVEISSKLGHTNYPIINKKNECLGMIRIIDINDYEKKQVILVDHNQKSQTVDDIEEANILEIIDHHNLGTIGTSMPINFRTMPVGCTCTIIYKLFLEANIEIPKDIAGIMLSAIISDTLLFKSPTTTDLDINVGKELAKIAGINIKEFGLKMFKSGSSIEGMDIEDILKSDIKTFKFEKSSLAISQITTMDYEEIKDRQNEFIEHLDSMCNVGNYKYALFFVTDIIKNGSYLFYSDGAKELVENAYGIEPYQGMYMDGVVSRKKQMLPPLLDVEERR